MERRTKNKRYIYFFFLGIKDLDSESRFCTAAQYFFFHVLLYNKTRRAPAHSFVFWSIALKHFQYQDAVKRSIGRMLCDMKQPRPLNPTFTSHQHIKITLHLHDEGRGTKASCYRPSLSPPAASERPSKTFSSPPPFFFLSPAGFLQTSEEPAQ